MKKTAMFTVFLVVLVDLIGFGIVLPLLPFYALKFSASPFSIGFLYSIYSLAQLVFSPFWGGLSDRIGRRPVMLLSTLGASAAYGVFAFAPSFTALLLSRLAGGMMGGNISTAQACVADLTSHENRTKGMGLLGAAFGIGFVLGPALAAGFLHPQFPETLSRLGLRELASLARENPYAFPGLFAAFLSLTSFALVGLKLPETAPLERTRPPALARPRVWSREFWSIIRSPDGSSHLLRTLFVCLFLLAFGQSSLYGAFPLFCEGILKMSGAKVGLQFAWMGLVAIVVQGGMIRSLEKKWGDRSLFFYGSILMMIGMALIPFSRNAGMLAFSLTVMAVGGSLNGPTLNSLLSKQAPSLQVGSVMGTAQGLAAMGRAVGPTWGGILFGLRYPLPFLLTASLLSFAVAAGLK
ncbi:MAG: MFS transporter, partial [Candidatus Omnitrophica bacterium]|nr:MFS transporter [Candidatus Omnitrophota bacterium]